MEINLDFSQLEPLYYLNPLELFWYLFSHGGWLVLLFLFIDIFYWNWLSSRQAKYLNETAQVLLAIDIPKDNEQSMVAVEQLFATLAGVKRGHNLIEKYLKGQRQLYFSLEILSLEGYIQFLIRTPIQYRDLVEAAVYAQYPEAEITEVEDFVGLIPSDVHEIKSDFGLWGCEFGLTRHSSYPIRTYRNFEHPLSQTFIDPMSSLLEVMSRLGKGEQLALQIIITPVGDEWKEKGYSLIKKLIGEKYQSKKHLGDKFVDLSMKSLDKFGENVIPLWGEVEEKPKKEAPHNLMMFLTAGDKNIIEGIENKLSKICFGVRFRLYYLAHNEMFKYGRGVNAILGAINQFNTTNLNAFKKHKKTKTQIDYFFRKIRLSWRQKKIVKHFKARKYYSGTASHSPKIFYLSIEELATLYHFPTITVKAPLLKRTELKKAEPPTALPIETVAEREFFKYNIPEEQTTETEAETPATAEVKPEEYIIAESLPGYDFDNNYFEERFAKKQTTIQEKSETKEINDDAPPANLPIAK